MNIDYTDPGIGLCKSVLGVQQSPGQSVREQGQGAAIMSFCEMETIAHLTQSYAFHFD